MSNQDQNDLQSILHILPNVTYFHSRPRHACFWRYPPPPWTFWNSLLQHVVSNLMSSDVVVVFDHYSSPVCLLTTDQS